MEPLSAEETLELATARSAALTRLRRAAYGYARTRSSVTKRVRDAASTELEDAAIEFASVEG